MSFHLTTRGRHRSSGLGLTRITRALATRRTLLPPAPAPVLALRVAPVRTPRPTAPKVTATDRVRVVDATDECFGITGFVAEFTDAASPILVSIPVPQPEGGHRFERRTYSASQLAPVVEVDYPGGDAPTMTLDAVHPDDVPLIGIVHSLRSRYNGCTGSVVEADEEGGYELAIPGLPRLVHFEASEVELAPEGAR